MGNEVWRDVVGYEGYYMVSDLGDIKSVSRKFKQSNGHPFTKQGMVLSPISRPTGYQYVNLSKMGDRRANSIHRVVASAFIPNPEGKPHVNHINGIKSDNSLSNLEWCTPKENTRHAYDNGLMSGRKGGSHHGAKLNANQVAEIRRIYKGGGFTQKEIAAQYNVTSTAISRIVNGVLWGHI